MTDSKHSPRGTTSSRGGVLDPDWEETLQRGQEEEGEHGSVEPELAFVHLLRHAREPEALAPEQLDAIWSAIEAEVAPAGVPWWRKAWVWWSAPALAAAAVLVVVIANPSGEEATVARQDQDAKQEQQQSAAPAPAPTPASDGTPGAPRMAAAELAEAEPEEESLKATAADEDKGGDAAGGTVGRGGAGKSAFEMNFAKLAPHGRLAIRVGVDQSRDELRSQLLATARGGGR